MSGLFGLGASADELARLKAGILGISGEAAAEAVKLAQTTQFSYQTWLAAFGLIEGHPQRDAIVVMLCGAAAMTGANPQAMAVKLIESGVFGDPATPAVPPTPAAPRPPPRSAPPASPAAPQAPAA